VFRSLSDRWYLFDPSRLVPKTELSASAQGGMRQMFLCNHFRVSADGADASFVEPEAQIPLHKIPAYTDEAIATA